MQLDLLNAFSTNLIEVAGISVIIDALTDLRIGLVNPTTDHRYRRKNTLRGAPSLLSEERLSIVNAIHFFRAISTIYNPNQKPN